MNLGELTSKRRRLCFFRPPRERLNRNRQPFTIMNEIVDSHDSLPPVGLAVRC
jgi:hypothetical protein